MSDGVLLATDVYLPPHGRPTEAILIRLPYDKSGDYTYMPLIAPRFVRDGYVVVVQDVRGKFRSGGVPVPWVNEVDDGRDTLDWIVEQPWSNGRVGMWGESYYGYTQWAAVSTSHPALRAIVPRMTGTQLGGPLDADVPEWFIDREYVATHFVERDTYLWQPDWRRPFVADFERFFEGVGRRPPAWDIDSASPSQQRRFSAGHPFEARPVPTLLVIGWFDNCLAFSWRDFDALMTRPEWRASVYLRVEAVDHEGYHFADVPFEETGNDHMSDTAAMRRMLERLVAPSVAFFDAHLREYARATPPSRVTWEQVHDRWYEAASWPPDGTHEEILELRAGRTLAEGRFEAPAALSAEHVLSWIYDPDDPVPSSYHNTFAMLLEYADEQATSRRGDVATFTGDEVEEALDLCGPVRVVASVKSSGPHMDVFVRLLDVHPDGTARFVARGQTRVRMPPHSDRPATATVSLAQVGYRFLPGHRLRILLANSDAFEYVPSPGTDEHPWKASQTMKNEQQLVMGSLAGTRLIMTVRDHVLAPG